MKWQCHVFFCPCRLCMVSPILPLILYIASSTDAKVVVKTSLFLHVRAAATLTRHAWHFPDMERCNFSNNNTQQHGTTIRVIHRSLRIAKHTLTWSIQKLEQIVFLLLAHIGIFVTSWPISMPFVPRLLLDSIGHFKRSSI